MPAHGHRSLLWSFTSAEARPSAGNLVEQSLEQLSNIVVMSVARRQESLANAPASIYVISRDETRSRRHRVGTGIQTTSSRSCARAG